MSSDKSCPWDYQTSVPSLGLPWFITETLLFTPANIPSAGGYATRRTPAPHAAGTSVAPPKRPCFVIFCAKPPGWETVPCYRRRILGRKRSETQRCRVEIDGQMGGVNCFLRQTDRCHNTGPRPCRLGRSPKEKEAWETKKLNRPSCGQVAFGRQKLFTHRNLPLG